MYPFVYLVTAPRVLNYKFSPASFWYLYSADFKLDAMIVEVNNTFGERRLYFISASNQETSRCAQDSGGQPSRFYQTWPKDFHVSPFNSRKGHYALSASDPNLFDESQDKKHRANRNIIDISATLTSSKGRPKFVARLWSNTAPLDPYAVTAIQASVFFVSWCWVGIVTCTYFFPIKHFICKLAPILVSEDISHSSI